ncbi:helix-turn-helix transcriptional regulator [Clostridium sp.]|uniref:helix-turn-helix transcriptional regulator n=1 Tax=Clostridium sp. TaxID=1506 RepID=UPI001D3AB59F|nr:helix-turn-helix transcriptional regulator [Clostridium sp.]MBS5986580.1 helix-turn-helix transcriptional regulator [Clostridium sp.]
MNMKLERIKKNWSQTDLSLAAKVCRTTISQIEKGQIDNIRFGTLKKLAAALNSTVEELFLKEE